MCVNLEPIEGPIAEIYGRNTFLKVKNDYFSIGKVLFSFVEWTENSTERSGAVIKSIDCCLDLCKAIVFAKDLLDGVLAERLASAPGNGFVWNSPIGGISEGEAAHRGLRKDGKAVARYFGVQSANKGFCRFTAMQMPGSSTGKGLIVPCKGAVDTVVNVPVQDREKLREFGAGILLGIFSYMAGQYGSCWAFLEKERGKHRFQKPGKLPDEKGQGNKNAQRQEKIVCDCYWSIEKGSIVENHGAKSKEKMLRMVVPRLFSEDAPLETDEKWQLADIIFSDGEIRKAPDKLKWQIQELIAQTEAHFPTGSIKQLPLKVGDIMNGHRQLFFVGG